MKLILVIQFVVAIFLESVVSDTSKFTTDSEPEILNLTDFKIKPEVDVKGISPSLATGARFSSQFFSRFLKAEKPKTKMCIARLKGENTFGVTLQRAKTENCPSEHLMTAKTHNRNLHATQCKFVR